MAIPERLVFDLTNLLELSCLRKVGTTDHMFNVARN
jgi:hypothetical protein